jgi:hypothetical protein
LSGVCLNGTCCCGTYRINYLLEMMAGDAGASGHCMYFCWCGPGGTAHQSCCVCLDMTSPGNYLEGSILASTCGMYYICFYSGSTATWATSCMFHSIVTEKIA